MTLSGFESVFLYSIEKGDNYLMECLPCQSLFLLIIVIYYFFIFFVGYLNDSAVLEAVGE